MIHKGFYIWDKFYRKYVIKICIMYATFKILINFERK